MVGNSDDAGALAEAAAILADVAYAMAERGQRAI
jgi:hypothetical protein